MKSYRIPLFLMTIEYISAVEISLLTSRLPLDAY